MLPGLLDPFWAGLLAKMLATAAIVVAVSALVERVGPFLGAMIATLPISAGPALVFAAVYARLAQHYRTLISVGGALAAWLLTTIWITHEPWSIGGALVLHVAVFGAAIWATRSVRRAPPIARATGRIWDLPFRAAIVMSLVAAVVIMGRLLGPEAAGTTAVAPMVFASVGLVLQPRVGGAVPAAMMANGLLGLIGLVAALAFLSLSATALGSSTALSLALLICVLWNLLLVGMRRFLR